MKIRPMYALIVALAASPAHAMFQDKPKDPAPTSSTVPSGTATTPRQEAQRWYGDAYDEVAKAKKDVADGKTKNAEKRFKKALDRGLRATELDTTYHEAWNLVGYCARKLGNYDTSIASYQRCLRIKPDYAPAREYLGEAYVELDKPEEAREQLVWLQRMQATAEAATLKAALERWSAEHPVKVDAAAQVATPVAAPADTTSGATQERPK